MSKWKTNLAIMAVLAVAATTLSASPTLAQVSRDRLSGPPMEQIPPLPVPEAFVPGPPTLTAQNLGLLTEPPAPGAPGLRVPGSGDIAPSERTTAMSRHSVDANGKGTAETLRRACLPAPG